MAQSELTKKHDEIKRPKYTTEEEEYISALQKRMTQARDQRDQSRDEWDGMDYLTQYEANERAANTFIAPKKNKEDTNFQSGVVRQKMMALLAAITNLNLAGDIEAYDKEGMKIQALGDAMEDIILKTNELDGDDEKKYLRQYELLKHGTVFVEEIWESKQKKKKIVKSEFTGNVGSAKWEERMEKAFARPSRNVIPGTNVYLGDMTKYDITDQPFIFTVEVKPYDEAKAIFGEWERWENVPRTISEFTPEKKEIAFNHNWRLLEAQADKVEILRFQDKWNNESAIIINNVLTTPVGLPLPFGFDEYTIVQQNLEPIHAKFAYGKSLVARIKNKVALLDEFMRLGILKTQKSFMPPYLNLSGRVLSSRVLMPGKISHGIPKDSLVPISDKEVQGLSNSELAMIRELQENINAETTSPTFTGQQAQGSPTATEIIELQRQAKMVLGLTVFSMELLQWKLDWMRLKNIINNWFRENKDEKVDEKTKELETRFRNIGVERQIEGEGMGRRIVVPTKTMPTPEAIMKAEDILSSEQGMPIRLIFLNPDELNLMKLFWQITTRAKEKKSSEVEKLLFRAEMADAALFGQMLNLDYLADRFATVWQESPQKMFKKQSEMPMTEGSPMASPALSPKQMLPTAEKALGQKVREGMGLV